VNDPVSRSESDRSPFGSGQEPPTADEERAEAEEGKIPGGLVACLAHVMDAEKVVIDQSLNNVEEAPADEHPAEELASVSRPAPVAGPAPEKPDPCRHRHPGRCVEETVPERVRFEPSNRGDRVAICAAQHVMPLQDLMKDDPVDEATQPDAEQNPRRPSPAEGSRRISSRPQNAGTASRARAQLWLSSPPPAPLSSVAIAIAAGRPSSFCTTQ
jgi:hypothetical protein